MRSALALAIVAASGSAWADKAASREHYEKARRAYAAAAFDVAIAELELAYREFPAPEYLHDLGQAYRRAERACEAINHFERYLQAKPDATNRAEVEHELAALSGKCTPVPAAAAAPTTPAPAQVAPIALETPAPTAPMRAQPASLPEVTRFDAVVANAHSSMRSPYELVVAGGVELISAGPVVVPPVGDLELAAERTAFASVHIGVGLSLARLPYQDASSGTVWLATPELLAESHYQVAPRWTLLGTGAIGATWISGLGAGNPFVAGGMSSSAIVTPRVRAAAGIAWRANDRVALRVLPLGYEWSPARGKLAADISALRGFAMSAGVELGW